MQCNRLAVAERDHRIAVAIIGDMACKSPKLAIPANPIRSILSDAASKLWIASLPIGCAKTNRSLPLGAGQRVVARQAKIGEPGA